MNTSRTMLTGLALSLAAAVSVALLLGSPWWVLAGCLGLFAAWLAGTRIGRQSVSVAWVGLTTIPQRPGSSAVIVVGIAGVVGVLVALLAMGAGFERTLQQTGSDDRAIVIASGARTEGSSTLDGETVAILSQLPQILGNSAGDPIVSAEQLIVATLAKKSSGLDASVGMRGVGRSAWELRPETRIVAGRKFTPGLAELVVGKGAHEQFAGLGVGSAVKFEGQSWTVVGIFDSGNAHNSEIWGDTEAVGSIYRRGRDVNSVTMKLTDARAFDSLKAAVQSDPRLKVAVETTRQFYNRQSERFARMIGVVGATIGAIMALGAIFGALNSTYSAIAGRVREIATLRAIGFQTVAVIVSVLLETMLLAVVGGMLGALLAWGIFDGFTASTSGASGQVVFDFAVSPALLGEGLKWALAIGLIGGLFPAVRAARMPVATSLREL